MNGGAEDAVQAEGTGAGPGVRTGGIPPAVRRARDHLEEHLDDEVTLETLARVVGMSPSHLHRTFVRAMGLTPKAYQDALRMERFKRVVRNGHTVSRATFEAGFGSSRALYDKADAGLGMSPASYRKGGMGATIRYGTARTPLGTLLVAGTERGICSVAMGDGRDVLVESLLQEYPRAELRSDADAVSPWLGAIVEHLEGGRSLSDLPLDVAATEFQRRVWQALRDIPRGETRSYGEVAEAVGRPGAARAVAGACAANPVALIVPCHRVVRADGSPGGYRWGLERKKRLLDREEPRGK